MRKINIKNITNKKFLEWIYNKNNELDMKSFYIDIKDIDKINIDEKIRIFSLIESTRAHEMASFLKLIKKIGIDAIKNFNNLTLDDIKNIFNLIKDELTVKMTQKWFMLTYYDLIIFSNQGIKYPIKILNLFNPKILLNFKVNKITLDKYINIIEENYINNKAIFFGNLFKKYPLIENRIGLTEIYENLNRELAIIKGKTFNVSFNPNINNIIEMFNNIEPNEKVRIYVFSYNPSKESIKKLEETMKLIDPNKLINPEIKKFVEYIQQYGIFNACARIELESENIFIESDSIMFTLGNNNIFNNFENIADFFIKEKIKIMKEALAQTIVFNDFKIQNNKVIDVDIQEFYRSLRENVGRLVKY